MQIYQTFPSGSGGTAAAQSDMETATDTTKFVTAGRQLYHPGHPKAVWSGTITPTALPGAATSWDTTAETALWNTAHGMTTGDTWFAVTNSPAGVTGLASYYINAADTTHFSTHLTLADAQAATNKINITGTALTTGRKFVFSNVFSYGMSSVSPVSGVAASTSIGLVFNLSTAFSSAVALPLLQVNGLVNSVPNAETDWQGTPSTVATKIITYANANLTSARRASDGVGAASPGTLSQQGTTAFSVYFAVWGDQ